MNTKDVDILNVILILVSLTLAFSIPFHLFIFSYAILGPLHYLTEINWLREKNYFIKEVRWMWLFLILAFVVSIPFLMTLPIASNLFEPSLKKEIHVTVFSWSDEILMISLLFAIGLIYFKNTITLLLFLIGSTLFSILLLNYFPTVAIATVIFIPTVIHVYVFTLLFMIYGYLNSKSTAGMIAIVLLILAPFIIMVNKINLMDYSTISESVRNSYDGSNFSRLNMWISKLFLSKDDGEFVFLSVMGIKIQIFVAFAYTYHYLNWFSKTSIIKWNKGISKSKLIAILGIWALSVGLYLYNFKVGFIVLSFLSLIHVFFEFPLNITSMKGIALKIKSRFVR